MLTLFPFTLDEAKTDFLAVNLVLLIYIFDKCFQVGQWFITHGSIPFSTVCQFDNSLYHILEHKTK